METTFRGTHFDGSTRFDTAHFYRDANFTGTQFQENADSILNTSFTGTHFHNKATFNNAQFHQNARANITGLKVSFIGSYFHGKANFDNTHFWRQVIFDSDRDADNVTTFVNEATFHNTHFKTVSFRDAVFEESGSFGMKLGNNRAKFKGKAVFCGAAFKSADFSGVEFAGVDFCNATFGVVDFSAANFGLDRLINSVGLSADFSHTVFEEEVSFRDIAFDRCTIFEGDARFCGAEFPQDTSLGLVTFIDSDIKSTNKAFGAVFKRGADFTEIKHDRISFRGVWFNAKLRNARKILFSDSIPLGKNDLPLGAEWKVL